MGLIQRAIEARGIPTVSLSLVRMLTEKVKPPRAVFIKWPAGHPFGEPNRPDQQTTMLKHALKALLTVREAGTIVDLHYPWHTQDYAGLAATIDLAGP